MFDRIIFPKEFYIEGNDLIYLVQFCSEQWQSASAALELTGTGEPGDPWILSTPLQWLRAALIEKTSNRYIQVGGRMLMRNARLFVSDQGPAWKYKDEAFGPHDKAWRAEDYSDVDPGVKAFEGNLDPSYRYIAQRVADPRQVFAKTETETAALGYNWQVETWTTVGKTRLLAQSIRRLLSGVKLSLTTLGKDYSRIQHLMPLLAGAMYLAEPGRNPRALPINLMLLDLAERGAFISLEKGQLNFVNMIVHPLLMPAGVDRDAALPKPIRSTKGLARKVGDLTDVGGRMPYSPLGGATPNTPRFATQPTPEDLEKIPEQHRASRIQNSRKKIAFQMNYINQKEADVIVRWLAAVIPQLQCVPRSHPPIKDVKQLEYADLLWPDSQVGFVSLAGQTAKEIHHRLNCRMADFRGM